MPFTATGSAHNWVGYAASDVNPSSVSIENFLKSNVEPLAYRTHFNYIGQRDKDQPEQLIRLYSSNFRKVVLVNNNTNCHLLLLHNMLTKARGSNYKDHESKIILKYKDQFKAQDPVPRWQLREMMSFWHEEWDCFLKDMYQPIHSDHIVNLEIRDLLHNFENCLVELFENLELPMLRKNRLSEVKDNWLPLQHFTILDQQCTDIVSSVASGTDLEFGNCLEHLLDEAFVQWKLRADHNLDLLCNNLNEFPINSKELKKLLVPVVKQD